MNSNWINHPALKNIDHNKLLFLQNLADQGRSKNLSEILPYLLSAVQSGHKNGLHFTREEQRILLDVLKEGHTPSETARIERIISLLSNMS